MHTYISGLDQASTPQVFFETYFRVITAPIAPALTNYYTVPASRAFWKFRRISVALIQDSRGTPGVLHTYSCNRAHRLRLEKYYI
jgi:hypothetical protein